MTKIMAEMTVKAYAIYYFRHFTEKLHVLPVLCQAIFSVYVTSRRNWIEISGTTLDSFITDTLLKRVA